MMACDIVLSLTEVMSEYFRIVQPERKKTNRTGGMVFLFVSEVVFLVVVCL